MRSIPSGAPSPERRTPGGIPHGSLLHVSCGHHVTRKNRATFSGCADALLPPCLFFLGKIHRGTSVEACLPCRSAPLVCFCSLRPVYPGKKNPWGSTQGITKFIARWGAGSARPAPRISQECRRDPCHTPPPRENVAHASPRTASSPLQPTK